MVLKADRDPFGQIIVVAQSRQLQIRVVLAHPLGPLPWALANSGRFLCKTNKAALARELEKNVPPAETIPGPSACIIGGTNPVKTLKGGGKTFAQIADSVLLLVLRKGAQSSRTAVVFYVYWERSVKNAEGCNRGSSGDPQSKNIAPGQNILQWRKFLSNPVNMTSLINFVVDQRKQPANRSKLQDKSLYVTCGEVYYLLNRDHWNEIEALKT